jgi:hypothetical protein
MSLSTILNDAASHRTGGVRSFPVSSDEPVWLKYAYDAPDQVYAKFFFRHMGGHSRIQPAAAAKPAAGWVIPDNQDCSPVFVAHSVLAAIWLLREMFPSVSEAAWRELVSAAQALSDGFKTPSPPPSTQRPAAVLMEDSDSDLDAGAGAQLDSDSDSDQDLVQSRKRKTPPASLDPISKRVCTPASTLSPAPSDETPSSATPHHVVTVTNNNRRSNVRIQRNITKAQEKRKLDLGLHPPAKNASRAEMQAYNSVAPTDVQHISWLFKQAISDDTDLYHTASSPYKTTSDMLAKARAVGHQDAWSNAASFLSSWRQHGTPFYAQQPTALAQKLPWTHAKNPSTDAAVFQHVWKMVDHYEDQLAAAITQYRWAMALLGRVYANKIAQLRDQDRAAGTASSSNTHRRRGKGKVSTEAVNSLLNTPSREQRHLFLQRLSRASRWYAAATALGWGSLCLMPPDAISNKWAEKTLTRPQWDLWIQLVKKIQPDAYTASRKLEAWLGTDGIEGGSIQHKDTLCIEAGPPMAVGEVEEVADSDMESESGVDSDGNGTTTGTARPPLRQLTLLELFVPHK